MGKVQQLSEYTVSAVLPALVDLLWPQVIDYLRDAIDHSNEETDEETTKKDLLSGDAILVVIYKDSTVYGAAVIRKRTFDTGIVALFVSLLGGTDMHNWIKQAYDVAKSIADDLGCEKIYCIGRDGWEKVLKEIGFKRAYTVLINDIRG